MSSEPRRLYREPDDQKVAGVCAGLADYFGLDPTIVRLAFVLLAITTWSGVILYIVAACVIPRRPDSVPRTQAPQRLLPEGSNTPVILILLVLAGLALVHERSWFDAPTIAIVLIGIGIWLIVADRDGVRSSATESVNAGSGVATTLAGRDTTQVVDPMTVPTSVPETSAPGVGPQGEVPPPVPPWGIGSPQPPTSPARPPAPPGGPFDRPRGFTIAIVCLGAGILALLAALDLVTLGFSDVIAGSLVIVGVAMVAGAWRGRVRWLVALGLPALGLLLLDETITVPLDAGMGDRTVIVDEDGTNTDEHELSMGSLTLDLRYVEGDRRDPPDIRAEVGLGELIVIVPSDMTANVDAKVRFGDIVAEDIGSRDGKRARDGVDAIDDGGVDVERSFTVERDADTPEGRGRLVNLDVEVGAGEVEIRHA